MDQRVTSMFEWNLDAHGVVTIRMDDPSEKTNTMNRRFVAELPVLVDHLEQAAEQITGVVLTSAKSSFFAGGDLELMMRATEADRADIAAMLTSVKRGLRRLERLGVPVVAVVSGSAVGGGCEIALACHHRIGIDTDALAVGLPEVTFGLLPGCGGTTRVVRRFGLLPGLQEILLTGRIFGGRPSLDHGLLDELVETGTDGESAARDWILAHPGATQPWDRPGFEIPGGTPADSATWPALAGIPALIRRAAKGSPNDAAEALVAAAVEGARVDFDSAGDIETAYCAGLVCGQKSTNLIRSRYFEPQAILRGASRPADYPVHRARRLIVLGSGMMGAGIAYVAAKAGMEVVLQDLSLESAQRGKGYSERRLQSAVASGRLTSEESTAILARITPTTELATAAGADLVIEAVFEDPELKKRVIRDVLPFLSPDAVVASNTSTLPISELAEALPEPTRFVGLHFFSPVDRMSLLEIVMGDKTSDETLAAAFDIALQLGKTPIVVKDARGFFTSRVILELVNEAFALIGEGVAAASVERAAAQAGYPVGPLALVDELTLTLTRQIRRQTIDGFRSSGIELPVHPGWVVVDRMLDEFDRRGRSSGAGFYDYDDQQERVGLWPGLAAAFGGDNRSIPMQDMQERLLFAEALDAVRCLDAGVIRSVADANVGSLLGIGFPAWTGGVVQYINQYDGGPAGFVQRCEELASLYGERFRPPPSLVALGSEALA
jgi:3-hydroxyacyl-CoA dehydrogenase/enoyl-CoA hydratase/3-hydroxybutyryl-CoA epimerase